MNIIWIWDELEWDPYTLLGEIVLKDNFGNIICDNCTCIDDWVLPLLKGLDALNNKKEITIELISEADLLKFHIDNNIKKLSYGNKFIIIEDSEKWMNEIKSLSQTILKDIRKYPIVSKSIENLLEYVISSYEENNKDIVWHHHDGIYSYAILINKSMKN